MNENRSIFALDGLVGFLIATALLLGILAYLSIGAMSVQSANSGNYYKLQNEQQVGSGIGFGEGHTTSKVEDHIVTVNVK